VILSRQLLTVFQVKCCLQWNQIRKQCPYNLIPFYTVSLKYYTTYSLRPLLFQIHDTSSGARYPMSKPHTPHRYNRIVVFNHCVLYPLYNVWAPACWNTTFVSQLEAELEAASVQQFADSYLSLCRQCIRYQTADHTLHHTYIIDIHFCKSLGRCLAQAVIRTARISLVPRLLGFEVDKVALGQVSSAYTLFHLSASLHQCSMFLFHLSPKLNNFSNLKRCAAFWGSSLLLCQFSYGCCCCFGSILLILIFFYMWQRISAIYRLFIIGQKSILHSDLHSCLLKIDHDNLQY
jgi:hypothetical protein